MLAIWVVFVLGIWLIISPWVLGFAAGVALSEHVVLGAAVILLALWIANRALAGAGALWTLLVFCLWIIVAPWILGYAGSRNALGNDIAVGLVILVVTVMLLARARVPGAHPGGGLE